MRIISGAIALAFSLASSGFAAGTCGQTASGYPDKAIRLVVPFPAAGLTDVWPRVVSEKITESLRQTFIADKKLGGNTIIGADAVAKAAPYGYTLLVAINNTLVMIQYLYNKLPYDPFNDFEPIGKVAVPPLVVVTHGPGPKSHQALVAQVKADPPRSAPATAPSPPSFRASC